MTTREPTEERREPAPVPQQLAMIFADLVGTATIAATLGDLAVVGALQAFFQRVASLQTVHHGWIIKTFGDGFLALFEDVADALHFATALQRSLAHEPLLLAGQCMALRVSLHVGAVTLMKTSYGDDVFGTDVNVAASLESHAQPGQIVVSDAVCQLLSREQQALLGPREHVLLKHGGQVAFRRLDVVEG